MGDILLEQQGKPSTPSAGQSILFFDNTAEIIALLNSDGIVQARSDRASTADQVGFASDTYVTGSGIEVPSWGVQAGSFIRWIITAAKTAAGTATPIYQVRIGSAQSTSDTSRLSITGLAQTAAADQAVIAIYLTVRSVSTSGQIQGTVAVDHQLAATGFANNNSSITHGLSAAFDNSALAGLFIGLSINGGTSASWTLSQVRVEAKW